MNIRRREDDTKTLSSSDILQEDLVGYGGGLTVGLDECL